MRARHTHTGSGRGSEILASVAKWSKNIHSKFQDCSYHSFNVISVLKPNFRICTKCSLFSDPITIHTSSVRPKLNSGLTDTPTECKMKNLKWSAIFPILHEFDCPCVQSECTMLKFWLAILEKWLEIGLLFCTLLAKQQTSCFDNLCFKKQNNLVAQRIRYTSCHSY